MSNWVLCGLRSLSGAEEFPGGFRGSTGESTVVDHVVKGMFVVTFEIGVRFVRCMSSASGGGMAADPKPSRDV